MRGWITPDPWEVNPQKLNSQCCCLKDLIKAIENNCEPVLNPQQAKHVLEIMKKIPEAIQTESTVKIETTF